MKKFVVGVMRTNSIKTCDTYNRNHVTLICSQENSGQILPLTRIFAEPYFLVEKKHRIEDFGYQLAFTQLCSR